MKFIATILVEKAKKRKKEHTKVDERDPGKKER